MWLPLCICGIAAPALAYTDEPLCALRQPEQAGRDLREVNTCMPTLHGPRPVVAIPWSQPISEADARAALGESERLLEAGKPVDALLQLRIVEHAMPEISDRIALRRAEALRRMGEPRKACEAYKVASGSLDRAVAAKGRVGAVHCLLEAADKSGEERMQALFRRYPYLTGRDGLRFKLAQAREAWNNVWGALALYRNIDVNNPASPVAEQARQAMARIKASGVAVRDLTPAEEVTRTGHLVRSGPLDAARVALQVVSKQKLSPTQRAEVHLLEARMARIEGRWDDVNRQVSLARNTGVELPEAQKLLAPASVGRQAQGEEAKQRAQRAIDKQVKKIRRGRPMPKLSNMQLRAVLDLSLRGELKEVADEVLEVMRTRDSLTPAARFDAAVRASGLAADIRVAELLETIVDVNRFKVSGRYHYGRALERLGRTGEAEAQYLKVIELDRSRTRYYAMWSDLRLWAVQSDAVKTCVPPDAATEQAAADPRGDQAPAEDADGAMALLGALFGTRQDVKQAGNSPVFEPVDAELAEPNQAAVLELLQPLVDKHGEAYPWLVRAKALIQLGLYAEAADELNETYLAYRDARGSPRLRSGLEAVYTNAAPPRRAADFATRAARRSLKADERKQLSLAGKLLGDPGTALRFGDWRIGQRPRAYAAAVQAAAKGHGLDPNLLFAVMRVESIYNRRIVSYAGAVGLMQIMPRTGRLIADKLGVKDFQVTDLLDPETNVEFAAWYLASLIKRFDGRLPLAIASYNGGPHNVRLWMRSNNEDMPLDAFLERIPFSQTHRYVRRVLTHYAAYRAQQNLPMTRLSVKLPEAKADRLAF